MDIALSYDNLGTDSIIQAVKKKYLDIHKHIFCWYPVSSDRIVIKFKHCVTYDDNLANELMFKCLPDGEIEVIPPHVYLKEGYDVYNASAQ